MTLIRSLLTALTGWRRRRGTVKTRPRAGVAVEHLDHRQLLSVTFTGNAIADIPSAIGNGTAIVQNPKTQIAEQAIINPAVAPLIKVSGMDLDAMRLRYTPEDDILSVAIQQPLNQKTTPQYPVIAGDTDNNLNGGTVDPAVLAISPAFKDNFTLGRTETMGASFDLTGDGVVDVVAGISNDGTTRGKLYQVARAVVNPAGGAPSFGEPFQNNTGFAFLRDTDPTRGAFEFQITRFSELYRNVAGKELTASTVFGVGGFAGAQDDETNDPVFFVPNVNLGAGPIVPPDCPPLTPPITVNPHQHRHINTAHPNYVRVNVFGTSGFDVDRIVPGSVSFAGASPVFSFIRKINHDNFRDRTYVFRGDELDLPGGTTTATISGLYTNTDGQQVPFTSSIRVFVRNANSYTAEERAEQRERLATEGDPLDGIPGCVRTRAEQAGVRLIREPGGTATATQASVNTVRIRQRRQAATQAGQGTARKAAAAKLAGGGAATRKARAVDLHDMALALVADGAA